MTDKQIIIDDQKKTIHRLQDECTEKTNVIIALGEQLQRKQQSEEKLVKQIQTICDFINNRPETFKGINGSVDKIITDYAKAKEQECEELKKIINEAKNSKLDLKSFLVGEAVQNEYEQQLDRLKAELEAYKMEAEEGKEINAELKAELTRANCQIADDEILQCDMREAIEGLKAENEELKEKNRQLTILGMDLNQSNEVLRKSFFATDKSRDNWREKAEKLSKTLTEIKEIAENAYCLTNGTNKDMAQFAKQILQKISEVEDVRN